MLIAIIHSALYRLRGHDFTDYYVNQLRVSPPRWAIVADYMTSKVAYAIACAFLGFPDLFAMLIISLGLLVGVSKGWTYAALHGRGMSKGEGVLKLTVRSSLILPSLLTLYFYLYGANIHIVPLTACFSPLLMGVVQYLCGFIPLPENAQANKSIFLRLWKGQAEMYEIIFGLIIGTSLYIIINGKTFITTSSAWLALM